MAVTPTTQLHVPPVVPSPITPTGRFSQNTLLIAGVVSAVSCVALAIFQTIAWTTAASIVASLAVCYAISYFLPEPGAAQVTLPPAPAAANDPLSGSNGGVIADPIPSTPPATHAATASVSSIIERAVGTPHRINASLQQVAVAADDDDSDDALFIPDINTTGANVDTSVQTTTLDTPHTPPQGRRTATSTPITSAAPSTPQHTTHARTTMAVLNQTFPSPARDQQPTDHTVWRREIAQLYQSYVELLRQIEAFLAPSTASLSSRADRQQAAEVFKQTLQDKAAEITRKLAPKRTFLGGEHRRFTSELQTDVQLLRARLDRV